MDISLIEIKKISDILKENSELNLIITGHTDDVGSVTDNQLLSERRAISVKKAIESDGINPDRVKTVGKGETEPIADNSTAQGRLKNRRTEFVLY